MTFAPIERDFHGVATHAFTVNETVLKSSGDDVVGLDVERAAEPASVSSQMATDQRGVADGSLHAAVRGNGELDVDLFLPGPTHDNVTMATPMTCHFLRHQLTCHGDGPRQRQEGTRREQLESARVSGAHRSTVAADLISVSAVQHRTV